MGDPTVTSVLSTRWDVYRDGNGNPVTVPCDYGHYDGELTLDQLAAVRHAVTVWRDVVADSASTSTRNTGASQTDGTLSEDGATVWRSPNMAKSRLLHRMIHEGKPPHDLPPPLEYSGGWWGLVEGGQVLLDGFHVWGPNESDMLICQHRWRVLELDADRREGIVLALPRRAQTERWILRYATADEIGDRTTPTSEPFWWLARA